MIYFTIVSSQVNTYNTSLGLGINFFKTQVSAEHEPKAMYFMVNVIGMYICQFFDNLNPK